MLENKVFNQIYKDFSKISGILIICSENLYRELQIFVLRILRL